MLSQLRTRGIIKHQAPVLNWCSVQLEEQRTDTYSRYHPDGHVLSLLLCKCPYINFLNLGIIRLCFFSFATCTQKAERTVAIAPAPKFSRKPQHFWALELLQSTTGSFWLQPRGPGSSWPCRNQRKGHSVHFCSCDTPHRHRKCNFGITVWKVPSWTLPRREMQKTTWSTPVWQQGQSHQPSRKALVCV